MIELVFLIAVIVLLGASVLLIANTIRLSIFSRRREIEVMKLVGATNWFVRGPFMVEGLLCGLGGAIAAVALLVSAKEVVMPAIIPSTYTSPDVQALSFSFIALDPDPDRPRRRCARLRHDAAPLPEGVDGREVSVARRRGVRPTRCRQRRPVPSGDARRTETGTRPGEAPEPLGTPPARPRAGVNAAVARAEGSIEITLPERRVAPETVVAHLGPTNSGKTYHALEVLKERGRGVYAGPLRMLAQEAHRRLAAELGEEAVGLVTGEERINDGAPIICCTVEMAPSSGEVLVLDEVQWADDPERGSAWTRLLLAGDYRHILLLGALDAEPLVLRAFPEAEVKVFERMLPLEFVGERALRGLEPGTVVVAFSRKAVLALAGEINRLHPARVSVLYGAMPLTSRREEIDRFLSGART